MAQICVIADDLTGLLDSTATFARRGLTTLVARSPGHMQTLDLAGADVLGVCTGSRHCDEKHAVAAVSSALDAMDGRGAPIVFKKIDSRLKGNVKVETRVLVERLGYERMFVCPAVPHLGRIVRNGAVTGAGVAEPLEIDMLQLAELGEVLLPEAHSQAMLNRSLAETLSSDGKNTLLVGAQGLAEAVASFLRPTTPGDAPPSLPGPLLLAVGSRDPITMAQVQHLLRHRSVTDIAAPNGRARIPQMPEDGGHLMVRMTAGEEAVGSLEAAAAFAGTIADAVYRHSPGTLLACGGDTADAILEKMDIGVLEVLGELMPGMAVSRTPAPHGLAIVTKSGGFGDETSLSMLVGAIAHSN